MQQRMTNPAAVLPDAAKAIRGLIKVTSQGGVRSARKAGEIEERPRLPSAKRSRACQTRLTLYQMMSLMKPQGISASSSSLP